MLGIGFKELIQDVLQDLLLWRYEQLWAPENEPKTASDHTRIHDILPRGFELPEYVEQPKSIPDRVNIRSERESKKRRFSLDRNKTKSTQ